MPNYSDRYYKSLNRQRAIPTVSLASAGFTPAEFNPFVYTPKEFDVSPLQKSLATLDERKEKTDQQRAAIQAAIGKVKLNEAETEWKQQFIDDIGKQIDNAAQFGDYSAALERATTLAGEVAGNQELLAKERENENYETWKKSVDTLYLNNKIDKNTKDYFLDKVKYRFNGTYDDNGNFKTFSLNEYDTPLQKVELSGLFSWVAQTVAEQSGSSQGVGARTATGGKTEYYSPDAAVLSHSGSAWSKKEYDTIKAVWDEAIKRNPEAIAYMQQQMDVNDWMLDNIDRRLETEDLDAKTRDTLLSEKKRLEEDLYVNGNRSKPYTPQEYLIASSDKTLHAMSYARQNTTFNVSGGGSGHGGYGSGDLGGGFGSLNFNPVSAGPSGIIQASWNKIYGNTVFGTGNDIKAALDKNKKK